MDYFLQQSKEEEEKEDKPKPFKLCFIDKNVLGQSNIKIGKPLAIAPVVSLKYYDKSNNTISEELVNNYLSILKNDKNVQESFLPRTENQKYGWYQVRLTDSDPSDRKLNFHKRTNIIVREHLMNYAKIRN
ncbi:uncharacterized protein LOC143200021 [Rhynchophorus ferrugineus]|uniref:uncharacterized protein LOC143200021 n=1 Tax=Rhynchophorus ferrugineus TaxID=354439 RepID=UPI003FCD0439